MKLNNVTVPLLMALLLSQKALVGDNRLKKLSVVGYNPPGCMGEQQALLATSPHLKLNCELCSFAGFAPQCLSVLIL